LFFATGIVFILLIGVSLFFPSFLPLFIQRRTFERTLAVEEEASARLKIDQTVLRISNIHPTLASIHDLAKTPFGFSEILDGFFQNAGEGIKLSSITLRRQGDIALMGVAKTRRHLLDFEKKLRNSGYFQEISSPLSNITREENINFTIGGKLNPVRK